MFRSGHWRQPVGMALFETGSRSHFADFIVNNSKARLKLLLRRYFQEMRFRVLRSSRHQKASLWRKLTDWTCLNMAAGKHSAGNKFPRKRWPQSWDFIEIDSTFTDHKLPGIHSVSGKVPVFLARSYICNDFSLRLKVVFSNVYFYFRLQSF